MLKSLKDISWLVDESTYRADKALSYSTISKFKREGFEHLDTLFDKVESPLITFFSLHYLCLGLHKHHVGKTIYYPVRCEVASLRAG